MCIEYTGQISKLEKGQVWFVDEPSDVTNAMKRHCEKVTVGTRPYLIISVGETNSDRGTVTCMPLTTNTEPVSSVLSQRDIIATTPEGLKVRFLVDQICSKTAANFRDFQYSIPYDLMKGIEFQIQSRLGLNHDGETLKGETIFDVSKKFWRPTKPAKSEAKNTHAITTNTHNKNDNTKKSNAKRGVCVRTEDQALAFVMEIEKYGYAEYAKIHNCTLSSLYQRTTKIRKKYGIGPNF